MELEVRIIRWDEFPKEDWIHILQNIEIGEYISSLPYVFPESSHLSIPVYPPLSPDVCDHPDCIHLTFKKLEFERVKVVRDGKIQRIFRRIF